VLESLARYSFPTRPVIRNLIPGGTVLWNTPFGAYLSFTLSSTVSATRTFRGSKTKTWPGAFAETDFPEESESVNVTAVRFRESLGWMI